MQDAISITNLKKNFKDFSLEIPSLTLPGGCILGLIGENGAGKSTTIRLILDLIRKDGGEISVLGEKTGTKGYEAIKEEIGVVFDEPAFPPALTGDEIGRVLQYTYRQWDRECFESLTKRFGLPMGKKFFQYSRGMKMKLSIAAALSHKPKLLILDEATSGLDPVVRDEILDIFMDFTREEDHSILVSSHIVSDLEKLCDYVAFLHKGQLLLWEEKDRLAERYGVIQCMEDEIEDYSEAVKGRRVTPYGAQILVDRTMLADSPEIMPVGMEDLFVYLVKEERR
ncbi:MAG: ABC transporter ATP-binding protein [Clostridia bacterium]|nr:ABC transporter ATP-binding protein [Clostridia bacterium]